MNAKIVFYSLSSLDGILLHFVHSDFGSAPLFSADLGEVKPSERRWRCSAVREGTSNVCKPPPINVDITFWFPA